MTFEKTFERPDNVIENTIEQLQSVYGKQWHGLFMVLTKEDGALIRLAVPGNRGQCLALIGAIHRLLHQLQVAVDRMEAETEAAEGAGHATDLQDLLGKRN